MAKVDGEKDQQVDPWTVKAAEGAAKIDYDKLIGKLNSINGNNNSNFKVRMTQKCIFHGISSVWESEN